MRAIDNLNKVMAYIPLVDTQDLSALPAIISELDQALLDESLPEAVLIQITRACKLAEHITLNETSFEDGIRKLSQNVTRLIAFLEKKTTSLPSEESPIEEDSIANSDTKNQSVLQENEMVQFRSKFASSQKAVLDDFEGFILAFEKGDSSSVQAMKRILHTWKGEFGVLELPEYSSLVHQIEESLEKTSISADQLLFFKDFLTNQFPLLSTGKIPEIPETVLKKLSVTPLSKHETIKPVKNETVPAAKQQSQYEPHIPPFAELDKSLLSDFINESRDHIHNAESLLLTLDSDPTNKENINSIFRSCHTIKGVAGFINLVDLSQLSHTMENLLDKCRKGDLQLSSVCIDLLIRSMDCLKEMILILEQCMGGAQYTLPVTYREIMDLLKDAVSSPNSTVCQTPQVVNKISDLNNSCSQTGQSNQDSEIVQNSEPQTIVAENNTASNQGKIFTNLEETIRVPVHRLDQLIDAIGEAVIAQSMITADQTIKSTTSQALITKITQTNMIMRQIQELSMSLRMVTLHATFQKMARLIRDLSKKSGKEIQFLSEGAETELDKSVVENIGDPLIHMIRNAVDHGLEATEDRIAKGKNASGTVKLKAYYKAGSVYIEISDDGKGLDKDLIFSKAISKGLCKPEAKLSDLEIYQFIFLPGFSTAKVITDISGRGVGMDVVKRNIEALRGSVEIDSEKDKGTTFRIRLPLTLAIIDGMIVRVDNATYILPTLSIIETLATKTDQIVSVLDKGEMIKVRENLIPVIYLSSIFNGVHCKHNGEAKVAMIVEDMVGRKTAFIVDEIIGQQQVVIKNLGNGIGDIAGISGGAIMSDGTVSLIIDVSGITKSIYN